MKSETIRVATQRFGLCAVLLACMEAGAQDTPAKASREEEIRVLREDLSRVAARLDALEQEQALDGAVMRAAVLRTAVAQETAPAPEKPQPVTTSQPSPFAGTTFNVLIDGYYTYNLDHPIGRVNLLRAYNVSSDSFSLSQIAFVMERLPQASPGGRFGGRIDLQFGQATETLQGSAENELRPQVWRNLYQAYGSYLAPVGSGLQVDCGKWASVLGAEGNYSKDQINYSRAFLYDYLPFYHMGFRANYSFTPKLNIAYWAVNGAQQTEAFNGSKSQAIISTIKPSSSLTWNVNYFFGAQGRDVVAVLNPGFPTEPTQPGLPVQNISPAPNGREHIFDTYATWNVTHKLTLVGEADYVINRNFVESPPGHTAAGAFYARYALPRNWAIAERTEYLDDRSGLFSGKSQALKEFTLTLDQQLQPGLLARFEYRRDFSNQPFFLTSTSGVLDHAQPTATVGLVYWLGQKQGSW